MNVWLPNVVKSKALEFNTNMETSITYLAKAALLASHRAWVPYSNYRVGAAILMTNGDIIHGCNVEVGSTINTIHAEVCAIGGLITKGLNPSKAKAMAVFTDEEEPWLPCGMCRQSIYELFPEDFKIVTCNKNGVHKIYTQEEMLPRGYNRRSKK